MVEIPMTKKKEDTKTEKASKGVRAELDNKVIELENNWKRALADYQNLQKRFAEEREAIVKFANATLLMRMLPVLDNLELMAKHTDEEGLEMTIKEFKKVLDEEGLVEIQAMGRVFDAQKMDAVEMVKGEDGKVVEVIQKGYLLRDKILRPARVTIGKSLTSGSKVDNKVGRKE